MNIAKKLLFIGCIGVMGATLYLLGHNDAQSGKIIKMTGDAIAAESQVKVSPVKARPRDTYYPNSEDLDPDEMRVVAVK
jgi:ribonuclease Z